MCGAAARVRTRQQLEASAVRDLPQQGPQLGAQRGQREVGGGDILHDSGAIGGGHYEMFGWGTRTSGVGCAAALPGYLKRSRMPLDRFFAPRARLAGPDMR